MKIARVICLAFNHHLRKSPRTNAGQPANTEVRKLLEKSLLLQKKKEKERTKYNINNNYIAFIIVIH